MNKSFLRIPAILLTATLLASCSSLFQKKTSITLSGHLAGNVTYQERVALPPDAKIIVSLEDKTRADRSGEFIAQQIIEPQGQVPVPFNLRYIPAAINLDHHYVISALITDSNEQLLWSTDESIPVEFARQDQAIAITVKRMPATLSASIPSPQGAIPFKCDEISFIARFSDNAVELSLPGERTLDLPQVISASGARYSDGKTLFWNKGDTALFTMNDHQYAGCHIDRAPLPELPLTRE